MRLSERRKLKLCAMRGVSSKTPAHPSTGEKQVHQERLRAREVGLRDRRAPRSSPEANARRRVRKTGAQAGSRAQVGCSPDPRGPAPGSLPGLARAAGNHSGNRRAEEPPRQSHVGGRERAGGGHLLTPTRRLTTREREAAGTGDGPRVPEGVALRALPAANNSPSPASAAAGYSRKAGRTWRAAASRGC